MKEKLSDFWYHYKWHTIVSLLLVLVIAFLSVQTCRRRKESDCVLLYAGPHAVAYPDKEQLLGSVAAAGGSDKADLYHYIVSFETGSSGTNYEGLTNFDAEIQSGEALILLLSPALYARVAEQNAVVPLDGYVGDTAAVWYDDTRRAVCLSSLPLAGAPGFSTLPGDTLLCLRGPVSVGAVFRRRRAEKRYRTAEETLRALLSYQPPESE